MALSEDNKKVNIEFSDEDVVESSYEVPTIMSKDQYDGIVEMNEKSVKKQVKTKKTEDEMENIKKELKELKDIMYLQIQVDKQSKQVSNIMPKKEEKMDNMEYIDLTNIQRTTPSLETSQKVEINQDNISTPAEIKTPLPTVEKKGILKIVVIKILRIIAIGLLAIISLVGITLLFKYVIGMNWFLSGIISLFLNSIILVSWYLLTRNPAKNRLRAKSLTEFQDLEFSELKTCPRCDSKLHKSKVINEGTGIVQYFKCKNIECDFQKKIQFPNQSVGY